MAIDAFGRAIFAWNAFENGSYATLKVRTRSSGGALGSTRTLSSSAAGADVQVVMGEKRRGFAVWSEGGAAGLSRIHARAIDTDGRFGPLYRLSFADERASSPQVAMDAQGDAIFVWSSFNPKTGVAEVHGRTLSVNGVLSPVKRISERGRQYPGLFRVAMDADGDAIVLVGYREDAGFVWRLQARAISARGDIGALTTLSNPGENATFPEIAMDRSGDAVVVWISNQVIARYRDLTGKWSAGQSITPSARSVSVKINELGNAVIGWKASDDDGHKIEARVRGGFGDLGPVIRVSPPKRFIYNFNMAMDAQGQALFAWESFEKKADGTFKPHQIEARKLDRKVGPLVVLARAKQPGQDYGFGGYGPKVALDGDDKGLFAWWRASVETLGQGDLQAAAEP